jgi:U3 small nucleolar ribonucleoprotein protein IMP4
MEFHNKLVITVKNPDKRTKVLCEHIRKMLEPNVTAKLRDKGTTVKDYMGLADDYELSHFILLDARDIRVGVRPKGPTYVFNIVSYSGKMRRAPHKCFLGDPLITFSGESEFKKLFESLSTQPEEFDRNIHIHFEDSLIHIRHYAVVTREEEDIKVGFSEVGPRLTLRFLKRTEGFFR